MLLPYKGIRFAKVIFSKHKPIVVCVKVYILYFSKDLIHNTTEKEQKVKIIDK